MRFESMKKILQATAGIAATLAILLSSFNLITAAAASATLAFSNKSPKVGEQVTITVTLNAGEAMYSTEGLVSYNAAVLRFESGTSCSASNGEVRIVDSPDGDTRKSYQIVFTAIAADSSTIKASMSYVNQNLAKSDSYGASAALSVTGAAVPPESPSSADPAVSNNANLSSLTVNKGALSPRFSAKTTSYAVSVENSVTKCTITAKAADSAATVNGTGEVTLKVGDNATAVTVTAADGTKKTYTINIKRLQEGETVSSAPETTGGDDANNPSADPLATLIGGEGHHIVADISSVTVPSGFEAATSLYNGNEVGTLKDEKGDYTLYYLTKDADSSGDYYTYNDTKDEFTRLPYFTLMGTMYIFAAVKEDTVPPEGYHTTIIKLGNSSVSAYCADDEKLADFYVLYCYVNGNYKFYSYDLLEGTMQRIPGFKLGSTAETTTPEATGLLARFGAMPTTGKAVVIVLTIAVLCAIALIVFLILHIAEGRKLADSDPSADTEPDLFRNDEFDEVDVSEAFQFNSIPKQSEAAQKPQKQPTSK